MYVKLNGLKMSFEIRVQSNLFNNVCHKVCIHSVDYDVEYFDCD